MCKCDGSLAGEMNVSLMELVGASEGFVWKLNDSCRQHALHEVDTYIQG